MSYSAKTYPAHQDSQTVTLHQSHAFLCSGIWKAQSQDMTHDRCLKEWDNGLLLYIL